MMPRLTAAAQNLYDLIEAQGLTVYRDDDIRLAVSRCVASENSRGWKITKDKQAHRIDVCIALMMAAQAAVQGVGQSNFITDWSLSVDDHPETPPTTTEQNLPTEQQPDGSSSSWWWRKLRAAKGEVAAAPNKPPQKRPKTEYQRTKDPCLQKDHANACMVAPAIQSTG